MKSKTFHAAAIVLALTASANAMAAAPPTTAFQGYAAIGDYIDVGPFDLGGISLSLSSTLASPPGLDLALFIYDDAGNPIGGSDTETGTWDSSGNPFSYSFGFSSPLQVVGGFFYALSYNGFQSLTNPDQLKVQLTDNDTTPIDTAGLGIGLGDIYAEDATSVFPLGFFDPATGNKINLTPVAAIKNAQGADVYTAIPGGVAYASFGPTIPEPATLALLGIGLASLGFTRRRKTAVVG